MLERRPKEIKIIPRSSDNRYHYLERFYDKQSIYKYMNLETALICLKLGKLRFSQISEWADEYEKRFYNADYSKLGNIKGRTPKLYACCFTTQKVSEAAWKTYTYGKTGLGHVCVKFELRLEKFRESLETYAKNNGCKVYESQMNYHYTDEAIGELHKIENREYRRFFRPFSLASYLSLLSIKRPAFAYEKEIRIFMVPDNQKNLEKYNDISIPWEDVVESISIDDNCTETEKELLSIQWEKYISSNIVEIKKERLYECSETNITIEGPYKTYKERIVDVLSINNRLTIKELTNKLGLNRDTLKRILSECKDKGVLKCEITEKEEIWCLMK